MVLELCNFQLTCGGFGLILINQQERTVFKLFKSYEHPELTGTGKEDIGADLTNEYYRNVFEAEKDAYEIVQYSQLLRNHTPSYYGTIIIDQILNDGNDVTYQYLPTCCYKMAHIKGDSEKLELLRENPELLQSLENGIGFKLSDIYDEFLKLGITYFLDSHVIYNDHEFKIIDFATKDSADFEPIRLL